MKSQAILKLDILLASPYVIIPFKPNNDPSNECWMLNLGTLKVKTNEMVLSNSINIEEKIFDIYDIELSDFRMQHFNTFKNLIETYSSLENLNQASANRFTLIPDLSIKVSVSLLKSVVEEFVKDKTNITLKASISSINLNFSPQIYQKLLKITECLILDEAKEDVHMMETEKSKLMSNRKLLGVLWRRHHGTHKWERYNSVLSGSYIYFYEKPKDLQASRYQYIRNSLVRKIDDASLGMTNSFEIENRYGKIFLACQTAKETEEWIKVLNSCQDEVKLRKEAKKITKNQDINEAEITKFDPNKLKLHIEFELDSLTLSLFEEDQKTKWLKYQSNSFKVIVKQYPYNVTVNLLLKSLEITDPWREYLNPKLNHFLSCVKTEGNEVGLDNFLEFSLNYMDRKHPNYEKTDTDIQISLGTFQLNFKPDTLLKILSFVMPKKEENTQENIAKAQLVSKETIEVKGNLDIVDPEIKTINVRLFLYDVSLSLVHRKNFLSIGELRISNTKILFQQKLQEMYLELELGNFQLIDLTNYPKTLYKESQFNEAKRRQLLGLETTSKEENPPLILIKFSSFQEGNPKIKNNINSMAQIEVSSVRVDFVMQPIFRILDYVLVQILGVLTNPSSFDENKKEMPQIEKPQEEKKELTDEKNKEKILSTLDKTPNISLDITIIKPLICLKASPDSDEHLLVDLGVIKIKNDRVKVNRSNSKEIYCDFYRIWMTEMGLRMIRNHKVYEMSRPYQFNLEVEKPCFIDDYKKVYKEEEMDSSLVIRSRILPIILSLYKADYLLIMKILFANISYDDMMDRFHIHDYVDNKKKPESADIAVVEKEKKASILINFQLDMDSINLFIMNPLPNYEKYNCPLSKISLSNLRLIFLKDSNSFLRLEVFADKLQGKYYEYESFLKESSLFGELLPSKDYEQIKYFSLSSLDAQHLSQVIGISSVNNEEFFIDKEKLNIKDPNLVVFLDMKPSGDKDIEIILNEIKVNAHGGVLLSLSGFATMDNSVTPPEPIGKSFEEEILVLPEANVKKPEPSKMNIKIDIKDLLVLISNPNNPRPLALKGNIGMDLQMKGSKTVDDLIKEAEFEKAKRKNNEVFNEYELNRVFHLDLNLKGIELFVCYHDEVNQALKRNILLPLNLNFMMNNYLAWTPNKLFLNKAKNQVLLQDKLIFRICYQDISNIKNIVDYQLSTLSKFQPPEEEKVHEVAKKSAETSKKFKNILGKVQKQVKQQRNQERLTVGLGKKKKIDNVAKTELVLGNAQKKGDVMNLSDSDFNITTKGIELIIVNDAGDAFIPVIDVNIDEDKIILKKNIIFMNLLSPFGISVDYFNPRVTKWEPIIEKAKFVVELTTNAFKNPHLELKITNKVEEERKLNEADPIEEIYLPLNINVSTQMLNVLMKTLNLMSHEQHVSAIGYKKEESKEEEEKKQEANAEEIEYVSPYSIKNETGYPIQVTRMLAPNMLKSNEPKLYTLENGETVNLQIESDRNSLFSTDSQSEMSKICVRVMETATNYQEIRGIELSRVRSFRSYLKDSNESKEKSQKNQNPLYLVNGVNLDTISNRRLITISSPLIFKNQTLMNFYLEIRLNNEKKAELFLPKDGWLPIPFDLVYCNAIFKEETADKWSKEYAMANMLKWKEDIAFEETIGKNYYMLTPAYEIINGAKIYGKTLMKIEPPFFFKNCLPVDIELQIKAPPHLAHEKYLRLKPQEEFHEYQISTLDKVQINIKIAGFGWSNFERLYAKNADFRNSIKLMDADGNSCTINIFHIECFTGSKHFFFYLKGYILNETTYNLVFRGVQNTKDDKKIKGLLAGQGKPLQNEPRNKDLLIFSENVDGLEIFEKNSEEWVSKEVPLGTVGDTAVEFKTKAGFVHLGVSIKLLCVGKQF